MNPRGLAALTLSAVVACLAVAAVVNRASPPRRRAPAPSATADARGARALRGRPKTDAELPTTEESIYLENLDGQITELERIVRENPATLPLLQKLSASLHLRGRIRGDLSEIQRGIDTATECVEKAGADAADALLLRAEQEQTLHRFEAAAADLDRAARAGGDASRIAALRTELDWNAGRYEAAIAAIRAAREAAPSTGTWLREAQLEQALGRHAEADVAYETAEDRITDTAPLPVAHLYLQRGIHRSQQGRVLEAIVFFREAARRMPSYVAASEHLAEALAEAGHTDEAIALYEGVVARSSDPEFPHALSALYATKKGDPRALTKARELEARARAGYAKLLESYPEAMYWHAAQFYADVGDHERALRLLRKNLALRPNSESYVALAAAELRLGHRAEARVAIDTALAMPLRSKDLTDIAVKVDATLPERGRDASTGGGG